MTNEPQIPTTQNVEVDEVFNFEDFFHIILSHWKLIVLCVIVALGAATLHIMRTTPTYTRGASLLIKSDDGKNGSSAINSISQDIQSFGIIGSRSNINNEIQTISAPIVMQEVVKRLHLDVQMNYKQGLHAAPLYDQSPITLLIPQANDEMACQFKMRLKADKTADLYDFETVNGSIDKHVTAKMGSLARTPIGVVVLQATQYWTEGYEALKDKEITVTKYPVSSATRLYSSKLSVALSDKESTILALTVTDESKQRADDLMYKLIDVYNEQWVKDRNRVAENTSQFINERLDALTKELGDVDQKISDYKSEAMLPDVDAASSMYMTQSSKNFDQILTLKNQLSVARYIREYLADRTKQGQYLPTNTGIGSTGIEKMIAEYNKTVTSRNDLLTNSSESTPLVQKLTSEIALQKQTIMHSLDNLTAQLQSQINNWEATNSQTNQKLAAAPQQVKKLLSVGRQQKVKEALYIYLLQKREENELSKTYTAWNTRLIQPPMGNPSPSAPRRSIIMLVALALGFCLPIGLLYLRETMNHKVRGRVDLDKMQTPLIGEIPNLTEKKHWYNPRSKNAKRAIYIKENCNDLINESFRMLRTKLDYFVRSKGKGQKVIMITSFNPGSGKSFITANLSKVLSIKNARVVAIDFDLRHASLSTMMGNTQTGITSYLTGLTDNLNDIIVPNAINNGTGDLIPVGILPPNPAELLLERGKMEALFKALRERYDYIILDCPPIDIVTDSNIVKEYADITLFVVRAGLIDRRALNDVEELYTKENYKHMAIILNGTTYIRSRYGNYKYGYGYGYGYGYTQGYYGNNK